MNDLFLYLYLFKSRYVRILYTALETLVLQHFEIDTFFNIFIQGIVLNALKKEKVDYLSISRIDIAQISTLKIQLSAP